MAGSGTFVDVTENHVDDMAAGYAGGRNVLIEKYDQTFALVEDMKTQVVAYLGELNSTLTSIAMPAGWQDIIGDVVIDDVAGISLNSISPPGALTLPGFEEVVFPLAPLLKTSPVISLDYSTPVKPTDVNPVLGYSETPYTSEMWLDLFTKVHDGLLEGGTGLGAAVEAGLWTRARERQRVENEDAYLKATRELGARGITFPQLALRSIEQRMAAEVLRQNTVINAEIAIKQAELAQTNTNFLIERAVQLEQILREFHQNSGRLSLEAKKAAAQLILENYAEKNKAYIAQWQGIDAELRAKVGVMEAYAADNKVTVDSFRAQMDGAIAQTDQIAKERSSLVEAHKADGDVYASKVRAQADWYNALTENQKAKIEKSRLELEKAVQEVKALLDSTISINALREKILDAISNIAAQVLASALNAVNTSIGHSTSASENRGEHWSHGDSISETHGFNEE